MNKKEIFIEKAIKKHGYKYDYSKVEYKNCKEKVCIICPKHGEFWQTPDNHLQNGGCPKCSRDKANKSEMLSMGEFLTRARFFHGDKYDYSKTKLNGVNNKVCIICPKHGEFWQTPNSHVSKLNHHGCPKCKSEKLSKEQMLDYNYVFSKAKEIHGNKFDYSESIYKGKHAKMKIKCNICGNYFWQEPNSHLNGSGCPHCANKFLNTQKIIKMFKEIHGDKYDYSKVEYKTMNTKVCIICPKHGEFWQTPYKHLRANQGCPFCKESHLEEEIRLLLEDNNIKFDYDKSKMWLGKQRLDFYLPEYNIGIECQGIQHFKPSSFSSKIDAEKSFNKLRILDKLKLKKCKDNNVILIYYSNLKYKTFLGESVFNNKMDLIKKILSYK